MKQTLFPYERLAIQALMKGPAWHEKLSAIAKYSNSFKLIAGLRRKGLEISCGCAEHYGKDGNVCYSGRYSLTPNDRLIINTWLD